MLASPFEIGAVTLRNRAIVAPMSGVTDLPMRRLAWRHGAGAVVSEMIASREYCQADQESRRRAAMDMGAGGPRIMQLAGREPHWMEEAARIATGEGAEIIDINMGCPAKKVTGGMSGSALMREPELALKLIEATVKGACVPVTVKMRLGWDDDSFNAPDIASHAEAAGVSAITVHGRTREQFYNGTADWKKIRYVVDAVQIPVIVNGDIVCAKTAARALEQSGAAAVMVGRAHYGAPWAASLIAGNAKHIPQKRTQAADYVIAHYEEILALYGAMRGVRHARKHLGWYANTFKLPGASVAALMQKPCPAAVIDTLRDAFAQSADLKSRAA